MHTKQKIQQILTSAGLTPNHRRGQNFLIDLNLMRLLIDSANINETDIVLEVGPGTGSLTEELARLAGKVIAVELDTNLSRIVEAQLADFKNVKIIETDILKSKNTIDSSVINAIQQAQQNFTGRLLLVSNLPYSIASPTMINLVTAPVFADEMHVTVQKEVAQRMTAEPASEHYGTLSILLSATGDLKIIRTLKPTVFWPQPQVESAMISFARNVKKADRIHSIKTFGQVIALFMQHRRKMLKASVKFAENDLTKVHNWNNVFQNAFVDPQSRPEEISPEQFISIANLCFEQLH